MNLFALAFLHETKPQDITQRKTPKMRQQRRNRDGSEPPSEEGEREPSEAPTVNNADEMPDYDSVEFMDQEFNPRIMRLYAWVCMALWVNIEDDDDETDFGALPSPVSLAANGISVDVLMRMEHALKQYLVTMDDDDHEVAHLDEDLEEKLEDDFYEASIALNNIFINNFNRAVGAFLVNPILPPVQNVAPWRGNKDNITDFKDCVLRLRDPLLDNPPLFRLLRDFFNLSAEWTDPNQSTLPQLGMDFADLTVAIVEVLQSAYPTEVRDYVDAFDSFTEQMLTLHDMGLRAGRLLIRLNRALDDADENTVRSNEHKVFPLYNQDHFQEAADVVQAYRQFWINPLPRYNTVEPQLQQAVQKMKGAILTNTINADQLRVGMREATGHIQDLL